MMHTHLRIRWEKVDENEFISHYELVLNKPKCDERKENSDDTTVVVTMNKDSVTRQTHAKPCVNPDGTYHYDVSIKHGAQARDDAVLLGDLPVYAIAVDGTMIDVNNNIIKLS